MENVPIPPEFIQDPPAVNQPDIAHLVGRDPERTPMQWDTSPNAGFSAEGVQTWLPVAGDYAIRNVATQEKEPTSPLNLYKALATLRYTEPALGIGDYASVDAGSDDVFAYTRTAPNAGKFLVALNFVDAAQMLDLSAVAATATIAVATGMVRSGTVDLYNLQLGPNEGLVLRL